MANEYAAPHFNKHLYFVNVYQVGGTENFEWKRAEIVRGYDKGCQQREEILRMGYPCQLYRLDRLEDLGMPTEYCDIQQRKLG